MHHSVLIVDDDHGVCTVVSRYLKEEGYNCMEASGADHAMELLASGAVIDIVLVDIRMPDKSGLDLLADVKKIYDNSPEFVVMTGNGQLGDAIEAIRLGARDFVTKPIDFDYLLRSLRSIENQILLNESHFERQHQLGDKLEQIAVELNATVMDSLETLAMACEYRDTETGTHNRRLGLYAGELATGHGWPEDRAREISLAACPHDLGKIGLPDHILYKEGPLSPEEMAIMEEHTHIGHNILRKSKSEIMQLAAKIALSHHEKYDGSGYPDGLHGEAILMEARMVAICDVYDSLRSKRAYKKTFSHAETVTIILTGDHRTHPKHFDPSLLTVFEQRADAFARIFEANVD